MKEVNLGSSDAKRFGLYLRRLRESRKLSLDAVEELAAGYPDRITKSHLSRIENGLAEPTFRRMAGYWGVRPRLIGRHETTDDLIIAAGEALIAEGVVEPGEHVVMVAGIPPNQGAQTNLVQIHRVGSGLAGGSTRRG